MSNFLFIQENMILLEKELSNFGRYRGKFCPFLLRIGLLGTILYTVEERKKCSIGTYPFFFLDKMRILHVLKWCIY